MVSKEDNFEDRCTISVLRNACKVIEVLKPLRDDDLLYGLSSEQRPSKAQRRLEEHDASERAAIEEQMEPTRLQRLVEIHTEYHVGLHHDRPNHMKFSWDENGGRWRM